MRRTKRTGEWRQLMKVKTIRRSLGLLTCLTLGASFANASTIFLPAQILPFGTITGGGSQTVYFDKFDVTSIVAPPNFKAVLTSVAIGLDASNTGLIQVVNFTGANATFSNASSSLPLAVTATGL